MTVGTETGSDDTTPARRGRKRDASRDADILDAALDVLGEAGYAGMTIEGIAARVGAGRGTLYRRWPSKAELALDAVARLNAESADFAVLPDTGTLAGDLRGLVGSGSAEDDERRLRILAGLTPMLVDDARLARAIAEPWTTANRTLLRRAIDRGEIAASTDVDTLAALIPTLATYRVCIERLPIPPTYIAMLIDTVLLPAVGLGDRQQ
jgi:AcrR family transcriptional regulator